MSIRVITIDYWNTLFDSSMGVDRNAYRLSVIKAELDRHSKKITVEEFDKALAASWDHFNTIWIRDNRTPLTEESVEFFWNYLGMPHDAEAIVKIAEGFANSIIKFKPKVISGVPESLDMLSKKYKLAVISDTGFSPGTTLRELLDSQGLLKYFSAFSFSDETGVSKPDPRAFAAALDALGASPGEAVHIGDIEDTDIKGAKAIGMHAVRYSGDTNEVTQLRSTAETIADAETHDWREIPAIIDGF